MTLKTILEALIFGSPKPIAVKEMLSALSNAAELTATEETRALAATREEAVVAALQELQSHYLENNHGFRLIEQVNGWTMVTNPETAPWVKQLYPEAKPTRLSGPALETLAIVAYRQPVTRADIEAVRGVAVDGVMQVLLDRGLVKISGRADVPGRPLLYGTTEYFLQHFGLKTVDELPNSAELKRVMLPTAPIPEEGAEEQPRKARKSAKAAAEDAASPAAAGAQEAALFQDQPIVDKPVETSDEELTSAGSSSLETGPGEESPPSDDDGPALDNPADSEPKSDQS